MKRGFFALLVGSLLAGPAAADNVRKACVSSDQGRGKRSLCACIQRVADQTLTARDQKLVARFFKDPDHAQAIRQSESRTHEHFWERYEQFGQYAEDICRG